MYASSVISSSNFKKVRTRKSNLSLGLALPFQPCMQDEQTMHTILKDGEKGAYTILCKALERIETDDAFQRLQKIFSRLNYNSHCKSLAVLITPRDEKIFYLDFPLKPAVYLSKNLSLLEIITTAARQPGFYNLILENSHAQLYEYHHNELKQVYATRPEPGINVKSYSEELLKQVSQTIERINWINDKPVFITGNPALVEMFCNGNLYSGIYFRHLNYVTTFNEAILKKLVKEINSDWNYWHSKFIIDRIIRTKKTNALIAEIEVVLKALRHSVDGVLLVDKRLKQQLYKSRSANALFNTSDEFLNQVERFLIRGNRLEITEAGLLQEYGGIVLLQRKPSHFFTNPTVSNTGKYNRPDTF